MTGVKKTVDKLVDIMMIAMFIIIFLVVLAQIFYRYILGSPLVWSEELSRFIFIWVSLVGWVLATRSNTHIRITFFAERLPKPIQRFLDVAFKLCTLAFLGVLVWLGATMAYRTFGRSAVTIPQIPIGMFYAALPVSALLCMFYVVYDAFRPALPRTEPAAAGKEAKP